MPFLHATKQVIAEQPLVQRDLGTLEHGANRNGELLAALVALEQPVAVLLALEARHIGRAAVHALGLSPQRSASRCLRAATGSMKRGARMSSMWTLYARHGLLCQVYNCLAGARRDGGSARPAALRARAAARSRPASCRAASRKQSSAPSVCGPIRPSGTRSG